MVRRLISCFADSFHGPQTLFMVCRLFSWSTDSFHGPQTLFMVRRLFTYIVRRLFTFKVRRLLWSVDSFHGQQTLWWSSDSIHGLQTLLVVRRLFSWSADSFIVHSMDSPSSTSSLTASMHSLDLLSSTSLVDHFHCQPHCRLPASAGLSASLTLLSTASVLWTYFVDIIVNGQRPLDLLCRWLHC